MTNVKKSIMWRVVFGMVAVALFAIWITVSMFKIQWVEGDYWLSQSDSLTIVKQDISPARGNIFSDDGSLLATSTPIYEIRWDATVVKQDSFNAGVDELAIHLSELFSENTAAYYRAMLLKARSDGNRYKLIRRKADYHQQKKLRSFPIFRQGRFKGGFIAELTTKRVKPAGELAARTIGYRTQQSKGVGLERTYDSDLGGTKGKRLAQRISGGYRPINDKNLVEPENGRDIHTNINIDFQEIVQRSLSAALDMHKADHGSVVIMETATGKIKAISNLKNKGEGKLIEDYNYAIGEGYEPGSVWKVFSTMAALEDGLVQPEDTINLMRGYREYFGKPMRDSDEGKHGKAAFKDAFARSSNVAFSSIVFDNYYGKESKYLAHLKKLDLDKPTGIEILGEPTPILNNPQSATWSNLTLPWLAIGYENQHTPLQIITAYNAVVNDGLFVKPQLVQRVTDAGVEVVNYDQESTPKRVCTSKTSQQIRELAAGVFVNGTAASSKSTVVKLAGKTGTAQIASSKGYQYQKKYNTTIVGHFPADIPVFTMIVMINKPNNGKFYSSQVVAPVFKEIAERIFTIGVQQPVDAEADKFPKYATGYLSDIKQINSAVAVDFNKESSSELVAINQNKEIKPITTTDGRMPNVVGMGARDAMYVLELRGLRPKINGAGIVREQSPVSNTKVNQGRRVYISLN